MNSRGLAFAAVVAAIVGVAWSSQTQAQENKGTFVRLGNGVPGVLYEPATIGPKAGIGVFVMHAEGDYLQMSACTELSKRGYRVLCANNSTDKAQTFDPGMLDRT